ncbi:MAG: ferrous iron transport protein B [Caldilineales bacterium]|nr:ferrous iron transport protein B [Caldilineales bacterium]
MTLQVSESDFLAGAAVSAPPSAASNRSICVDYGRDIEAEIAYLSAVAERIPALAARFPSRWLAIQLLEEDALVEKDMRAVDGVEPLVTALAESRSRLRRHYGDGVQLALADHRYQFVHELAGVASEAQVRVSTSEKLDAVLTHRYLGLPIFLALMYLTFSLVQNVSAPYLDWIDAVISGPVTHWLLALLALIEAPVWLVSLVIDGVVAGVGGVLVFVPGLVIMYLCLGLLEDSGYMPRAALVMDRFLQKFGLHGKSFLPMIVGFGCNVPAIYATRTIESRPARLLTGLMIPFMSCSARLPVYVIFGLAFFPRHAGWVIWGLYLFGIVLAAVIGLVVSKVVFKGQIGTSVITYPPYRRPHLRNLFSYTWSQSAQFIKNAGTVLLLVSVVLWFLLHLPWNVQNPQQSLYGRVSTILAPTLAPAGFGEWELAGSLITGIIAKEMIISSMSQLLTGDADGDSATSGDEPGGLETIVLGFAAATVDAGKQLLEALTPGVTLFPAAEQTQDTGLTRALPAHFTPLAALAFLVFVLTYLPCIATLSAQAQEFGWRWASLSAGIQTILPWLLAVAIFQFGRMLGLG